MTISPDIRELSYKELLAEYHRLSGGASPIATERGLLEVDVQQLRDGLQDDHIELHALNKIRVVRINYQEDF